MYHWNEDMNYHANVFANFLNRTIGSIFDDNVQKKLLYAKNYIDNFYNWELRSAEWTGLLQGLIREKKA